MGRYVYVGGGSRATVFEFTFSPEGELKPAREFVVVRPDKRTHEDFIGDVAVSPDGKSIYAADLYHDSIVVINAQSGSVIERITRPAGVRIASCFIPMEKRFSFPAGATDRSICTTPRTGDRDGPRPTRAASPPTWC